MSRRPLPALVLALSLAVGCGRCGGGGRAPVERILPRGAVAVAVAPDLGRLGQRLTRLQGLDVLTFLAPTQGFADARAFTDALLGQLGVDLRSPAAVEAAGLDPTGALGVAVLVSGQALLAAPVKDPARLQAKVAALAQARLGAGVAQEQTVEGVTVHGFARAAGGPPALGYVVAHGYALVAAGPAVARLPGLARLSEADSLAADAELASRLRASAGADLLAWVPTGSPVLAQAPVESALLTVRLVATGLVLVLEAPWKAGAPEAAALEARPATAPGPVLPADAFLTARYQGEPALATGPLLQRLGKGVQEAFQKAGLEPGEVLSALAPGAVASLSLADRPPLERGLGRLDPKATNPFAYVHLVGAAPLTSADAGVAALERLKAAGPALGARLEAVRRPGGPALVTTWAQGEGVHLAIQGDRLLFASPLPRLDAALAGDGGVDGPGGEGTLKVRVDLLRLARAVRELPESAWGLGGFAMKATAVRWLEAVSDLTALDLRLESRDGRLKAWVTLELTLEGQP